MRLFHCDEVELPLPAGHRFPATKYRLLRESLLARGRIPPALFTSSSAVPWESLALAHDPAYLKAIRDGRVDAAAERRLGFPWSQQLVERSRRSVGGTVEAARRALAGGFAANLAGGTHHAFADHGEGYCVFNDVGTAVRVLQQENRAIRCAVIDLDVHQGNGTAAMFDGDRSVFTLSLHGRRNFPFRKQRSTLDVELDDGCDDATYLAALDVALHEVLDFTPYLVFYVAGVDVLATDTLGLLELTPDGAAARDTRVLDACAAVDAAVVMVMGGGYSKPIELSVDAHVRSYEALAARALGPR